jgi:hypothetical protein
MLLISVFVMNYIKQRQADKAEALDSARSVEAAINHLIVSYRFLDIGMPKLGDRGRCGCFWVLFSSTRALSAGWHD